MKNPPARLISLRSIPVQLPSSPVAGGTAFFFTGKRLPASRQGLAGPFNVPANPPPAAAKNKDTFPDWVEYLVKFVGDSLEKLNGLQFDMTRNNADTKKRQIVTELSNLAAVLDIGRGNNPKELRWPLAGSYICNLDSNRTGFTEFTVALYFENEPDYRLVVNCSVEIVATGRTQSVGARSLGARSVAAPDSSSSSYVATSSK